MTLGLKLGYTEVMPCTLMQRSIINLSYLGFQELWYHLSSHEFVAHICMANIVSSRVGENYGISILLLQLLKETTFTARRKILCLYSGKLPWHLNKQDSKIWSFLTSKILLVFLFEIQCLSLKMAEEDKISCLGAGTQLARCKVWCKVCSCPASVSLSDRKFLLDWKIYFMLSSILNNACLLAISTLALQLHLLPFMHLNISSAMTWKCEENKAAETSHSSQMLIHWAMDAQRDEKSVMGPWQRNEGRAESPWGVLGRRWGDGCSGQADTHAHHR